MFEGARQVLHGGGGTLGVLVRHDPGHVWGGWWRGRFEACFGLNVSRTEILRKTCPVWSEIAKQFSSLASNVRSRLGGHSKTETGRGRPHVRCSVGARIWHVCTMENLGTTSIAIRTIQILT